MPTVSVDLRAADAAPFVAPPPVAAASRERRGACVPARPGHVTVTLVLAWVVFPLVLAAVTLGCGLALEALAGFRLRMPLLAPVGLATAVVAMCLATMTDATAELAVPLVVAIAVAGLAARGASLRTRFDPWAVGAGVATYTVYAAPTVASGEATFAGYVKLDDTATYLGMLDYVLERGVHVTGLAPSTYEAMLALLLGEGYPLGSVLPLGLTRLDRRRSRLDLAAVPRIPRSAPRTRPLRARSAESYARVGCGRSSR